MGFVFSTKRDSSSLPGKLILAMLEKLHLPQALLRLFESLVWSPEILALTGNHLITGF
jgi:hypothetical protein